MFKPIVLEQISYGETVTGDEESLGSSPGEYKNLEVNKKFGGQEKGEDLARQVREKEK